MVGRSDFVIFLLKFGLVVSRGWEGEIKGPGTPNWDIGISLKMGGYWKLKWGYGISCHRQGILGY